MNPIQVMEDWARQNREIGVADKTRVTWMTPSYVSTKDTYIMMSQLFQERKTYDADERREYQVDYKVHPWVAAETVPHNTEWIPNPDLVQAFDGQGKTLTPLLESSNPVLHPGALVKVIFKIVFQAYAKRWGMTFIPVQFIRVKETDIIPSAIQEQEQSSLRLLKPGTTLKTFTYGKSAKEKQESVFLTEATM